VTSMFGSGQGGAFVTKLNASGSGLVYSDILANGFGSSLALDASGNAYVTGRAGPGFPTTAGAFRRTCSFSTDPDSCQSFVAKLSSSGTSLTYSTYFPYADTQGISIDGAGDALLTGSTDVTGKFITTPGAYDVGPHAGIGTQWVFVSKLNPQGSGLVYSTYIGDAGSSSWGMGIVSNSLGEAYVAGHAVVNSLHTTAGVYQPTCNFVPACGFLLKLNAAGSAEIYSTYLVQDIITSLAVDRFGNAYVAGLDDNSGFTTTSNRVQGYPGGDCNIIGDPNTGNPCQAATIITLNSKGTGVVYYSTYLGGTGDVAAYGIAVDGALNVYVVGVVHNDGLNIQVQFPTTGSAYQRLYKGPLFSTDAFVAKLVIAGDLSLAAHASTNAVAHGATLTYTYSVTNTGPDSSNGATLTTSTPGGTTFVSFSNTNGSCTHPAVGGTGTFKCTRSTSLLKAHSWGPITLTVRVTAASGATLTNTATVTAKTQDLVPANNKATVTVKVQ